MWAEICGVEYEMGVGIRKPFLYRFSKRMYPYLLWEVLRVEHIGNVIASTICSVSSKFEFGCTREGFLESFYKVVVVVEFGATFSDFRGYWKEVDILSKLVDL